MRSTYKGWGKKILSRCSNVLKLKSGLWYKGFSWLMNSENWTQQKANTEPAASDDIIMEPVTFPDAVIDVNRFPIIRKLLKFTELVYQYMKREMRDPLKLWVSSN